MALMNRIEIVNYLCEGWQPSMGIATWRPLWPANVINLCGASTAIQVPNGCGKTSVTSAVLYLLSRDRTLKRQFLDRCAPTGLTATHIRIEFAILVDDDLIQRDLMTRDPRSSPAQTYVIGVCGNRGDDSPRFYRYPGLLEDVPASRMEGTTIEFSATDALRAGVKSIRGGQWDGWDTIGEWSKAVGAFMSPEVVRQNVQFHSQGAGDASAAFSKVKPGPGERFDEAYFRQVVAPQLLSNVMGDAAEEGERNVEDTILNSMNRFIDAKLMVEKKRAYLERREALEADFRPVIEAAGEIQGAQNEYQKKLQGLAVDAAFLARFAESKDGRIPGVPRSLGELILTPQVRDCLQSMVLDKDGSVLIESSGLAGFLGLSTGRLNELAERKFATREAISQTPASSQLIEIERDIKDHEGRGGHRKALRYYGLTAALELTARRSEDGSDQIATLQEAFDLARNRVDTNPFRHAHHRLTTRKIELKAGIREAEQAGNSAERDKERLEQQVEDRLENQGAYQAFRTHLHLLPQELHDSPIQVADWLATESKSRNDTVSDHAQRVGKLTSGWEEFRKVNDDLGLISIEHRISDLQTERDRLEAATKSLQSEFDIGKSESNEATKSASSLETSLNEINVKHGLLSVNTQAYAAFLTIFGDVDPLQVGPPSTKKDQLYVQKNELDGKHRKKSGEFELMQILADGTASFKQLFGDIDPRQATPQNDYDQLLEAQREAARLLALHQPLAESLESHLAYESLAPDVWIEAANNSRTVAQQEENAALEAVIVINRELSALDNLDLIGNADYAAAHEALRHADAQATRVRDVILGLGLSKDATLPLLAAFGSLLDAPVAANIDTAEVALAVLQAGDHDVPLLLLEPLVETLQKGPDHETGATASLLFLAGAKSRRMRAILDPRALEEERQDLLQNRETEEGRAARAREKAAKNSPETADYRRALHALDAVKQGSVDKAKAAQAELTSLEEGITAVKPLVTLEVLSFIEKATKFFDAGGDDTLAALRGAIAELAGAIATLDDDLAEIAPLLTTEAVVAHDGARKFVNGGGHAMLQSLITEQEKLQQQLSKLRDEIPVLEGRLASLQDDLSEAQGERQNFMVSFSTTLGQLERVKAFEVEGNADFMGTHDKRRQELESARDALNPLRSINYTGAQTFQDHQGEDEVALQRQISEATTRRQQAVAKAQELNAEVDSLEGEIITARQSAEALHELAHFLCVRRQSLATFEKDLVSREAGVSPAESHPSYQMAEELRLRLLDWRPAQGSFELAGLSDLREEVEAIDVAQAGKEVSYARKNAERVQNRFFGVRDEFCKKARSSADGGFSEAEIEAIEGAKNASELENLANIGKRLREQLQTEQSEIEELQNSSNTVETASIETLTRLVETSKNNLVTMNTVMSRNPNARFTIEADVISTDDIKKLMEDLRDNIEVRKRDAQTRQSLRRSTIDTNIAPDVRVALIDRIFTNPSVEFRHVGMWDGKQRPVQASLSEGQKSALQMLWLIKESEYHLECAVRRHLGGGSKKKLRSRAQRILFFDGLFSNLTDRALIDEAFKGLGEPDSNLQLIGLIHNQEYRNNFAIFPSLMIGRRAGKRDVEGQRSYIRFEDGRPEGSMGLATIMQKRPPGPHLISNRE